MVCIDDRMTLIALFGIPQLRRAMLVGGGVQRDHNSPQNSIPPVLPDDGVCVSCHKRIAW